MLVNRLWERGRSLVLRERLLAARGRAAGERRPVVLVPGMCGTRLRDERGRICWGSTARLYFGRRLDAVTAARPDGLLRELPLLPGLLAHDVFGGLVRALGRAGFVEGEDLFVLDHDWREGVAAGAAALAALIARVRGFGEERVDLLAVSTGGLVARAYLAWGGADPLAAPMAPGAGAAAVRRVVYLGAPQRGSFDALACLHRGFRFAPGGRRFSAAEAAACQTSWDALPAPGERLFVDREGAPLPLDHFDPDTWRRLGLGDRRAPGWTDRLERSRRLWRALEQASAESPLVDSFAIGAWHLPTPARVLVDGRTAHVPAPTPRPDDPHVGFTYRPGDGELPESSLRGLPRLPADRVWEVRPRKHAALPAHPDSHRLVIEALLASDRFIPGTDLTRRPSLPVVSA
jgi:hypothetical protein